MVIPFPYPMTDLGSHLVHSYPVMTSKLPRNIPVLALVVLSPRKLVSPGQTGMVGQSTSHWAWRGRLLWRCGVAMGVHLQNISFLRKLVKTFMGGHAFFCRVTVFLCVVLGAAAAILWPWEEIALENTWVLEDTALSSGVLALRVINHDPYLQFYK